MATTQTRSLLEVITDLALDIYRAQRTEWVSVATIREGLAALDLGLTRADEDIVLKHLSKIQRVHVLPMANLKGLTPAEKAAAVVIGGEACHVVMIEGGW